MSFPINAEMQNKALDFQNNSLRFDMHKIVAGIDQTKIVRTEQSFVAGFWYIRAMKQHSTVLSCE